MGNRSRRQDGTISDAPAAPETVANGSINDPLYGIPDTNMPYLAGIRIARALQGQRGWRRAYAIYALASTIFGVVAIWVFVLLLR